MRVLVWSGDGQTFIGEGTYLGDVTAYFIQMPDGCLLSELDAEKPPEEVPDGGRVVCARDMPKIRLDQDKSVVYGCQVYWKPKSHAAPEFSDN